MKEKILIPCIFLYEGKAVKWFDNKEVLANDVVALAKQYAKQGADELMILDLTTTKEGHKEAIYFIKQIYEEQKEQEQDMEISAGGNIKGFSDIQDFFDAGAKRVILNFAKPSCVQNIREVSRIFGKENIVVSLKDFDALFKQQHLIEEFSNGILFMHRLDLPSIRNITDLPSIVLTDTMEESEIIRILRCPGIKGVSGKYISQPDFSFENFKKRSEICSKNEQITNNIAHFLSGSHSNEKNNPLHVLEQMQEHIKEQKNNPREGSYTNYLFDKGIDKILKKVGEEAFELVIAAKNPNPQELKHELSDLLYHIMVLMTECGITWEDIIKELTRR